MLKYDAFKKGDHMQKRGEGPEALEAEEKEQELLRHRMLPRPLNRSVQYLHLKDGVDKLRHG